MRSTRLARQITHPAICRVFDVGEADDIHPRNKQDVGARLALADQPLGLT